MLPTRQHASGVRAALAVVRQHRVELLFNADDQLGRARGVFKEALTPLRPHHRRDAALERSRQGGHFGSKNGCGLK